MIITTDLETFYDKTYSLSKLTTQSYISSDQFQVIGIGVKVDNEPTVWHTGTRLEITKALSQYKWDEAICVMHNALFDQTILTWEFGIRPKLICDTLSMARAIHGTEVGGSLAKLAEHYGLGVKGTEVVNALGKRREDFTQAELDLYGAYCINDVELTYGLFIKLIPHFNKTEIKLIDMTVRMHSEPQFLLDLCALETHLRNTKKHKEELLTSGGIAKDDLMSNNKFADILRDYGVEPPMKISPTTGKETYAFAKTDQGIKDLLNHEDFQVQAIVAARLGSKSTLEETRTERFIAIAKEIGTLPVPLKYYGAEVSGRWSGTDSINMQNLARTSPLKEAIYAPNGYVIVGADLSNIEVRVNMYFSGQWDKLEIIKNGLDIYKEFATVAFGVGYDEVNKDQRFIAKTCILGLGFGSSSPVLRASIKNTSNVDIGEDEAKRLVGLYRAEHPNVVHSWREGGVVLQAISKNQTMDYGVSKLKLPIIGAGGIMLPSGFSIKYPDLRRNGEWTYKSHRGSRRRIYSSKVHQNVIQSLARCVMGEALVRINNRYKVSLTIHDSCYCIVPEYEAEEALNFLIYEMTRPPSWMTEIPLSAEGSYSKTLKGAG